MGLIPNWQAEFLETLEELSLKPLNALENGVFTVVNQNIAFNLLMPGSAVLKQVLELADQYAATDGLLINIWEDQWQHHKMKVIARLRSLANLNKRIHARACTIATITQATADEFLNTNHLQGTAKAKYRLALKKDNEILAVATFNMRPMPDRGQDYVSAELIRFCNIAGATVVGGLSKLINYFIETHAPDDVMTYADKDWSDGKGYLKSGFKQVGETPPLLFSLSPEGKRYTVNRLPAHLVHEFKYEKFNDLDHFLSIKGFVKVFNSGNRKFIRVLRNGS